MPLVELADLADPFPRTPVAQLTTEGVAGVGRIDDQGAAADEVGPLPDDAGSRALRMDAVVPGHDRSLWPRPGRRRFRRPGCRLIFAKTFGRGRSRSPGRLPVSSPPPTVVGWLGRERRAVDPGHRSGLSGQDHRRQYRRTMERS